MEVQLHQHFDTHIDPSGSPHKGYGPDSLLHWNLQNDGSKKDPFLDKPVLVQHRGTMQCCGKAPRHAELRSVAWGAAACSATGMQHWGSRTMGARHCGIPHRELQHSGKGQGCGGQYLHRSLLSEGSRWLMYRSRHCLPTRPDRYEAIRDHRLGPYSATSSSNRLSSSSVQQPLMYGLSLSRCMRFDGLTCEAARAEHLPPSRILYNPLRHTRQPPPVAYPPPLSSEQ